MNKVAYIERKKFVKYDDKHYLLYLNEEKATVTDKETEKSVEGFAYTGPMPDGSTMIEAQNVTDENRRDRFVSGLIGTEYDINAQIAILANGKDTEIHAEEFAIFETNRETAKKSVDELLARPL